MDNCTRGLTPHKFPAHKKKTRTRRAGPQRLIPKSDSLERLPPWLVGRVSEAGNANARYSPE